MREGIDFVFEQLRRRLKDRGAVGKGTDAVLSKGARGHSQAFFRLRSVELSNSRSLSPVVGLIDAMLMASGISALR